MSLNPFKKVTLHCSVSANVARDRLRQTTEIETPWTFTAMPLLHLQSSGRRYMGVIKGNSFRLFVRPYVPSGHTQSLGGYLYARNVTYLRDNALDIRGTIEPDRTGCTVHLQFKPKGMFFVMLPVSLAFMILMTVSLVSKDGLGPLDAAPLVFLGIGLYVLRVFYFSAYALEKDFLESLFTADANPTDSAPSKHSMGQYGP